MTVAVAYEALGRWTSGFGGSVLYFARVVGSRDLVKVGATMDLKDSLERLQRGNPHPLEYVTALPGTAAHARYLRRRFQPEHRAGGWFQAGPVLSYAEDARVLLSHAVAQDGRGALTVVLRELDPAIADLERLWRNGMPVREIAELTGQSEADAARGIRWLREMGFDLGYRHMPKGS